MQTTPTSHSTLARPNREVLRKNLEQVLRDPQVPEQVKAKARRALELMNAPRKATPA